MAERNEDIKTRSKVFSHMSATLLGLLFVFSVSQFELAGLNGLIVDGLYRTQWWKSPDSNVVLIGYDDDSSNRYDGLTKLPAEEVAQVFEALAIQKPLGRRSHRHHQRKSLYGCRAYLNGKEHSESSKYLYRICR